jgi:hypothetical protein
MALSRASLKVEQLGARIAPGAIRTALADLAATARTPQRAPTPTPTPTRPFQGRVTGSFTTRIVYDYAPMRYLLNGSATLGTVGAVRLTGFIQQTGDVVQGRAHGMLTLTNAKGTVTLSVEGPLQPGYAPLPSQFRWHVVAGTGAYERMSGTGTVQLAASPAPTPANPLPRGNFSLTF